MRVVFLEHHKALKNNVEYVVALGTHDGPALINATDVLGAKWYVKNRMRSAVFVAWLSILYVCLDSISLVMPLMMKGPERGLAYAIETVTIVGKTVIDLGMFVFV